MKAQQAQISIRDLRIKQDENQIKVLTDQRDSAEKALNAWYRSPYLWAAVGAGLTAYLIKR